MCKWDVYVCVSLLRLCRRRWNKPTSGIMNNSVKKLLWIQAAADLVVYMWITDGAVKAWQDTSMIRVTLRWPWGKLKSVVLKLFILRKKKSRQPQAGGLEKGCKKTQRCKALFCIPDGDSSIFPLSFIRHRLKSTRHSGSFLMPRPRSHAAPKKGPFPI